MSSPLPSDPPSARSDDPQKGAAHDYLAGVARSVSITPVADVLAVCTAVEEVYRRNGTIFICGNGGSATTCSHLAADLAKNTHNSRVRAVRAVSLVDQVALLTAWANDTDYAHVFSNQLSQHAGPGDAVIGISTSGNSANVVNALITARRVGAVTIGLLGQDGGRARELCDVRVLVRADGIDQQEDVHLAVAHVITRHMRRYLEQCPEDAPENSPCMSPRYLADRRVP